MNVVLLLIAKNIKFETYSCGLQFSEKDPTSRRALKPMFLLEKCVC